MLQRPTQATPMLSLLRPSLMMTFVLVQGGSSVSIALMWKMQGNTTVSGGRDRKMLRGIYHALTAEDK